MLPAFRDASQTPHSQVGNSLATLKEIMGGKPEVANEKLQNVRK